MAENRKCPECAGEMERGHVGFDGQKVFWAGEVQSQARFSGPISKAGASNSTESNRTDA